MNEQSSQTCLSRVLDDLGYSSERAAERIRNTTRLSDAKTTAGKILLNNEKLEIRHVGSQGEGIALAHESDTDILQVDHSALCVGNTDYASHSDAVIFQCDRKSAPPGYTYLRLIERGKDSNLRLEDIKNALIELDDKIYLSSRKYLLGYDETPCRKSSYVSRHTCHKPPQGPSLPKSFLDFGSNFQTWWFGSKFNDDKDFVRALPCVCYELTDTWCTRPRTNEWPTTDLIEEIGTLEGYVVPVGFKGSPDEHLQWRISFTLAEMRLVQSLNDTQRKVLILLRHIAKKYLKPKCNDITSYIMKNVLFWVAENTPLAKFDKHLLLDRLQESIDFLKTAIAERNLPNYMIPERNLFRGKISDEEGVALFEEISDISNRLEEVISSINSDYTQLCNKADMETHVVLVHMTKEQMVNYITKMVTYKHVLPFRFHHTCKVVLPYIRRIARKFSFKRTNVLTLKSVINGLVVVVQPPTDFSRRP